MGKLPRAKYRMRGKEWRLQCEGLHDLCFTCGKYGHHEEGCPSKMEAGHEGDGNQKAAQDFGTTPQATSSNSRENSSSSGPWMVAQRQRRLAATQKGNLGSTKDRTDVEEGEDQAGKAAKQPVVNGEQPGSRQSRTRQSAVNTAQQKSRETVVAQSAERMETVKTPLAREKESKKNQVNDKAVPKHPNSTSSQTKQGPKGSAMSRSRFSVLAD